MLRTRLTSTPTHALVAGGLLLAACGGDDDDSSDALPVDAGAATTADQSGAADGAAAGVGSGSITWEGQTYEFDFVGCGGMSAGFTASGPLAFVNLEDPDDLDTLRLGSIGEESGAPWTVDTAASEVDFDGSQGSGTLVVTSPKAGEATFEISCG